ncbi:cytochrome P450 [Kineosporia sp. A_224]|uniref:cytochrome P450 n=1 Tax=Kineosporia sp. A_224 TaxID=1962180 RepID=UPI00117A25B1|nr:cytochrome P450 [Kineosporia sp. A_224]
MDPVTADPATPARPARPGRPGPRRNARYTGLDADGPLPLDMLRAVPAIRRDPLTFLEGLVARYGDLVAFPMPRGQVLLMNTPDGARRVLVDNARAYGKATVQYGALSLVTGAGLLTTDGEVWRRHRRVAQPAFHPRSLESVAQAAGTAAQRMRAEWDAAGPGGVVDADGAAMRAMLEVVGRTLFAADLRPVGERVVGAVDAALHAVVRTASSPLPGWLPTPRRRRLRRAVATLDAVCADLVAQRRACGVGPEDGDVLALLLAAVDAGEAGADGGLAPREVRDEILTLVIAGHETVASSLTWTLDLLASSPDVQARLHTELDAVLAGRAPGWDDVPHLPYTRAVVDEALRLYPPAWVITRRALADDVVSGVAIPAGTLVVLSPWLLHRRPQSWPDPRRFDPGRFLGDAPPSRGPARGDYVPFGAGPRLCIGRDMAVVESVLVLAGLLRDRTVTRPAGVAPPSVDALVTLRPRGGLPLRLTPR